jgi:hypothetical protein
MDKLIIGNKESGQYYGLCAFVKPHYTPSRNVSRWEDIEAVANDMVAFKNAMNGCFQGNREAYAISHCQVSESPWNFFVVAQEFTRNFRTVLRQNVKTGKTEIEQVEAKPDFKSQIVVNPKILDGGDPYTVLEGCMSFPFRKAKKITRMYVCEVSYQFPDAGKLVEVREMVYGQKAQAFQHAVEHSRGKNIYSEGPAEVAD